MLLIISSYFCKKSQNVELQEGFATFFCLYIIIDLIIQGLGVKDMILFCFHSTDSMKNGINTYIN